MPIVKTKWTKRLAVTLCTMLLMCAALPVCAFADDVHIFTAYQPFMYFEKYDGVWGDLGTPPHSVVETGQPAYCLQMSMESPYGDGYDATDGSQYYTPTILNGLKAILAHGYPASTGGFTDNEAQYATANAIRFFLAENGIQEMPCFFRIPATHAQSRGMMRCLRGAWSFWNTADIRTRIIPYASPTRI